MRRKFCCTNFAIHSNYNTEIKFIFAGLLVLVACNLSFLVVHSHLFCMSNKGKWLLSVVAKGTTVLNGLTNLRPN